MRAGRVIFFLILVGALGAHPSSTSMRGLYSTTSAFTEGEKTLSFSIVNLDLWGRQFTRRGIDSYGDSVDVTDRQFFGRVGVGFTYSVNDYFSLGMGVDVLSDLYIVGSDVDSLPMPNNERDHIHHRASVGLSKLELHMKGSYPLLNGLMAVGLSPSVFFPIGSKTAAELSDTNDFLWLYTGGYMRKLSPEKTFGRILLLYTLRPDERIALHLNLGYETATSSKLPGKLILNAGTGFNIDGFEPFLEFHAEKYKDPGEYGNGMSYYSFGFRLTGESGSSFLLAFKSFTSKRSENYNLLSTDLPVRPHWGVTIAFGYLSKPERKKPPVEKKIEKGIIAGKVIDAETGEPIMASITLTVDTLILYETTDTVTGLYKFENVPPGVIGLAASSEGYEKTSSTVVLKPGETVIQDFALKKVVKPVGIITGTVKDEKTGAPLKATVSLVGSDIEPVLTDSTTGFFKIEVPPGTYALKVESEGYVPGSRVVVIKDKETKIEDFKLLKKGLRLVFRNIYFETGKADLKPESYPVLDTIAEMLKAHPNVVVEIQGHTDSTGSFRYNMKLSQKRAEAVKKYLVDRHGIKPDRLIAKGYGPTKPVASNKTKEGRAKNRRVEFVILGEKP